MNHLKTFLIIIFVTLISISSFAVGEKHFDRSVFTTFSNLLKSSKDKMKPMFIIVYDDKSKTKSKMDYNLGYFFENKETRTLVKENFIIGVLKKSDPGIYKYLPDDFSFDNCLIIILNEEGKMINNESIIANPEHGLKRVKSFIDQLNLEKYKPIKLEGSL